MKKEIKLFSLVAGLGLFIFGSAACNKDDNDGPENHPLVGNWNLYAGGTDENDNGQLDPDEQQETPARLSLRLTFKADKSGSSYEDDGTEDPQTERFTWTTNTTNTKLTVYYEDNDTAHIDINKLTATELEVHNDVLYLLFNKQ